MDRYKKKAIAFASVEGKRNLRFLRKSIDRSNVRHKRLSELRKFEESALLELPDEKTPVKEEPKKMTYLEKLKKWKEEKELKKQLEARKKLPAFKVCRVNPARPPPSVPSVTTSKNKEPLKFLPKSAQPSRVALKTPVTSRDVSKPLGKVAPKPAPAVNTVSRSIPNSKESVRTIPTTKNNSRQLPAGNTGTKAAVLPSRPQGKPPKSSSTGNGAVSSAANCSISRVVKPPSSNSTVVKQTPKAPGVSATAVTSKATNQRTGIASRIVPPRSCNKQGTAIAKADSSSSDSSSKAQQEKIVPAPKGINSEAENQTKSFKMEKESDLMSSICEEKSGAEKKRATKSFAPEDFVFEAPDNLGKFVFPFGSPSLTAMYADMFGVTLPWNTTENNSSPKTRNEDSKKESEAIECKVEAPSCALPRLPEEHTNVSSDKEESVVQLKLESSPAKPEKTPDALVEEGNKERKEKPKDVFPVRQLGTISENSPLPNDLELGSDLRFDMNDDLSGEKAYKPRRSRRLASNHFGASSSLDTRYFLKTKSSSSTVSDLSENPIDSPLASVFSELNVDSPSDTKQHNFRFRKTGQENRISLLGSPVKPQIGPRKSIKGDLICFTP